MMATVDVRPRPCVTQVRHGSVCKISPPYIMPFQRRSQTTLSYLVNYYNYSMVATTAAMKMITTCMTATTTTTVSTTITVAVVVELLLLSDTYSPSALRHCWLGSRKGIQFVKKTCCSNPCGVVDLA